MRIEYRIISINDVVPKDRSRRTVSAVVEIVNIAETAMDRAALHLTETVNTVTVSWPAYGVDHYTASVGYLMKLNGRLNHTHATAISHQLKTFVEWPPEGKDAHLDERHF